MPIPITHDIASAHLRLGNTALLNIMNRYSIGQRQDAFHYLTDTLSGRQSGKKLLSAVEACRERNVSVITWLDEDYPLPLRFLHNEAPPVLYLQGNTDLLKLPAVAVIGSRSAGKPGKDATAEWVRALCCEGWVICSGNANGIDSTAHRTALLCGGKTIFFSFSSPEEFQPRFKNPALNEENSLIISPFPPTYSTHKGSFLKRNTLLASFTKGGLVMETGIRSGTLDTVNKFRAADKPVYLADMPIGSPRYEAHSALASSFTGKFPLQPDSDALHNILSDLKSAGKSSSIVIPLMTDLFEGAF